jgi:hypothetical protein
MLNVIRPEINISAIFRTGTSLKYIYKNYIEMREWMEKRDQRLLIATEEVLAFG